MTHSFILLFLLRNQLRLTKCISDIRLWMQSNLLKLNDSKTEIVLLGSQQQLSKLNMLEVSVGNVIIKPCSKVRNLGVILDATMIMEVMSAKHHIFTLSF